MVIDYSKENNMDNGNNLNIPFVLSVSKSQSWQKTKSDRSKHFYLTYLSNFVAGKQSCQIKGKT